MSDRKQTSRTGLSRQERQWRSKLTQLVSQQGFMRGSLQERTRVCGKPNCKCAKGPGHGPKHYLSVSRTGTHPAMDYVPQAYSDQVTQYLDNHRQIRTILDEVSAINRELLHRREAF